MSYAYLPEFGKQERKYRSDTINFVNSNFQNTLLLLQCFFIEFSLEFHLKIKTENVN